MDAEDRYQRYVSWLRANGAVFPNVFHTQLSYPCVYPPYSLIGVAANSPISRCSLLCSVPFTVCLTPAKSNNAELRPVFHRFPKVFEEGKRRWQEMRLSVFLMREKIKGRDSFYSPYIDILPDPETLADWSEAELSLLKNPVLTQHAHTLSRQMLKKWTILQPILAQFPDLFPLPP